MSAGDEAELSARARLGDQRALADLFEAYHARLVRMVALRLDAGLQRRVDPTDVVQDAWIEVLRRVDDWRARDELPFRVWLRLTTRKALIETARRHLKHGERATRLEERASLSNTNISARNLADALTASASSPTQAALREEQRVRVLEAVAALDPVDREIVALRQFEGLSNADAAAELSIEPAAASKRYARALLRLRPHLRAFMPDSEQRRK